MASMASIKKGMEATYGGHVFFIYIKYIYIMASMASMKSVLKDLRKKNQIFKN
jgi:hypothetical protein